MISPWEIYWVMQLDAIGGFLIGLSLASWALLAVIVFIAIENSYADPERWSSEHYKAKYAAKKASAPRWTARARRFFVVPLLLSVATTLLPSTKVAAAMLVIPAIANNETIQKEAGDLYKIAKDGLRELVKPERAEKVEK